MSSGKVISKTGSFVRNEIGLGVSMTVVYETNFLTYEKKLYLQGNFVPIQRIGLSQLQPLKEY